MGFDLRVDVPRRLVHITFDGTVNPATIAELRQAVLAHPDFDPGYDQLIDGRAVEKLEDVDAGTVRAMAGNREGVHEPGARRAFVMNSDLKFGLARIFELLANQRSRGVRIFRDYDEAVRWLDEVA